MSNPSLPVRSVCPSGISQSKRSLWPSMDVITAGHDLEGIIKLSDAINRIAKRQSKPLVASR